MLANQVKTDINETYSNCYISPVAYMPGFYRLISKDKTQVEIINGRRITVIKLDPETPENSYFEVVERRNR